MQTGEVRATPAEMLLERRRRTTNPAGKVVLETIGHYHIADYRIRLVFPNLAAAQQHAIKLCRRRSIRLVAWRKWELGPNGRELLGCYNSTAT